jgi:hypothetical protein
MKSATHSAVDVVDGSSSGSILPDPLDLFRFRNLSGEYPTSASQFSTLTRDMIPGDDDLFSDTHLRLQFSTGAGHGDSRGASHWKDDVLTGNYIGIMDPSVVPGGSEPITADDVRALQLIGWTATSVPEPPAAVASACLIALIGRFTARRPTAGLRR